jgi:hypothetical protein
VGSIKVDPNCEPISPGGSGGQSCNCPDEFICGCNSSGNCITMFPWCVIDLP